MKYLKKISLLGVLVLFLLVVAACGSSTISEVGSGQGRKDQTPLINEQTGETITSTSGKIGDYEVTIYDDYEVLEYFDDSNIIVVTYDFTNNSKENNTFSSTISDKVFQSGIRIHSALLTYFLDAKKFKGDITEIQPGATITLRKAYKIRDTTSPVTIEIEGYESSDTTKITKEFNLQ
ncbi:hypothetical protein A5881_002230 [Enterococcus termitis]|nr:hypothetical protein A5881_001449 [Enterococcus termitis]